MTAEGDVNASIAEKKESKPEKPKSFGLGYDDDDDNDSSSGSGAIRGPKANPMAHTYFSSASSEGDVCVSKGDYRKAAAAFTKALELHRELEPALRDGMVRAVLVARSKCWNQLGMSDAALLDADRALRLWEREKEKNPDCMKDYYKGLLAKAEALYSATEFEHALVFYHRGDRLRHELDEFRLGIQKCRRAITNAIGDPGTHHLEFENCEKPFLDELRQRQERKEAWKERLALEMKRYNEGGDLDFNIDTKMEPPAHKGPPGTVSHPTVGTVSKSSVDMKGTTGRIGSGGAKPQYSSSMPNAETAPPTQKQKVADLRRTHGAPKANAKSKKTNRQLLGSLHDDQEFLQKLLGDKDFNTWMEKDEQMTEAVASGLQFLHSRKEFWRQQKPLYARQREEQEKIQNLTMRAGRVGSGGRGRTRLKPINSGAQTDRGPRRPAHQAGRARPRSASRVVDPAAKKSKNKSREAYFEATRYAIQTLENVNNALEYGNPELGLTLAKNFLARIGSMELADKPRILGNLYCSMGNTYLELNKPTLAAIHHRKDLDIAETYKFGDATMRALGNLGRTYRRMGDFKQAIGFFERQASLAETAEDDGRAHLDVGRCHFEAAAYKEAIQACTSALQLATEANDTKCMVRAHLLLAQSYYLRKQYKTALPHYETHVSLAKQADHPIAESTQEELELVRRLAKEEGDTKSDGDHAEVSAGVAVTM